MKKSVIGFIVFLFLLFVLTIFISQNSNKNKLLSKESEIILKATQAHNYKGFITINDSITISENTPRVKIDSSLFIVRYEDFGSLETPFNIIKKHNNDTIVVIKDYKTFYYMLNY